MWKRILLVVLVIVASLAGIAAYKIGPRNIYGMLRYDQRRDGDLKLGDTAPDVELVGLDGTARPRLLEQQAGKPLVIVFGSFT